MSEEPCIPSKNSKFSSIYKTPYPSLANATLLMLTPAISPSLTVETPIGYKNRTSLLFNKLLGPKRAIIGSRTPTCFLFASSQLLGSYLVTQDYLSGSGFCLSWSALYLLVAGKGNIHYALRYGRFWPLLLSSVASVNCIGYGSGFMRSLV